MENIEVYTDIKSVWVDNGMLLKILNQKYNVLFFSIFYQTDNNQET